MINELENNKLKRYVVFGTDLAKYLTSKGLVWDEIQISHKDKNRVVFYYIDTDELHQLIHEYKHQRTQKNRKEENNS